MPVDVNADKYDDYIESVIESGATFQRKTAWFHAHNSIETLRWEGMKEQGLRIANFSPLLIPPTDENPLLTLMGVKTAFFCSYNHRFRMEWQTLLDKLDGKDTVCPHCRRLGGQQNGVAHRDARFIFTMTHHERGEDVRMSTYESMSKEYEVDALTIGKSFQTYKAGANSVYRSYIPLKDRTVKYATDGVYAFVWAGPLDADDVYHPVASNLIGGEKNQTFIDPEKKRPTHGPKSFARALSMLEEEGLKPVNVWRPRALDHGSRAVTVLPFGQYSWGSIAKKPSMVDYKEQLEEMWLDWQRARLVPSSESINHSEEPT